VLLIRTEDDSELDYIMSELPADSVEVASIELMQRDRTYDGTLDDPEYARKLRNLERDLNAPFS